MPREVIIVQSAKQDLKKIKKRYKVCDIDSDVNILIKYISCQEPIDRMLIDSADPPVYKARWGLKSIGKGKRGGLRFYYADLKTALVIVCFYYKKDRKGLTKDECAEVIRLVREYVETEL